MIRPATESPSPSTDLAGSKRPRVRLSPEVRRQQILDAALTEFSTVGFEGATMDKIAQRVGLTKAGIYAHFKGKEDIFETLLLSNIFRPSLDGPWQWQANATLEDTVDRYLDAVYQSVQDERLQATFRLLITESGRAPELIRKWHRDIFQPHAECRQQELDECVRNGVIADNAISRNYALTSAPALLAMISLLLAGPDAASHEVGEIRAAHRYILLALLAKGGG